MDGKWFCVCCRDESEVASQTEDRLLEVLKAVGARVDSAVGTFTDLSHFGRLEQSQVLLFPVLRSVSPLLCCSYLAAQSKYCFPAGREPNATARHQLALTARVQLKYIPLQEAQQAAQEGQELIKEVWGVVADYYLDARGSGFDLQSWTRLRDKYLAHPLPTHDAAYRCSAAS